MSQLKQVVHPPQEKMKSEVGVLINSNTYISGQDGHMLNISRLTAEAYHTACQPGNVSCKSFLGLVSFPVNTYVSSPARGGGGGKDSDVLLLVRNPLVFFIFVPVHTALRF